MEQNIPMMAKKLWRIVRVALFMLRKGISKGKIFMDLSMMLKRGKIAGKALSNLMFHHHHHGNHHDDHQYTADDHPGEYEFSCSNTPLYTHYFTNNNKRKNHHNNNNNDIEKKVIEMMLSSGNDAVEVVGSPGLGFGPSPMGRKLRITDSPYQNMEDDDDDNRVDEAAEAFINKFYSQLKKQK